MIDPKQYYKAQQLEHRTILKLFTKERALPFYC